MTNDGKNTTRFQPQFPPSCPWVTAVGGTEQVEPEIATWLSGGGFSDVFARPDYQAEQVGNYLNKTVKDRFKGLYNRTGRGIPDIAAQAQTTYPMFHMGEELADGGTRSVLTYHPKPDVESCMLRMPGFANSFPFCLIALRHQCGLPSLQT